MSRPRKDMYLVPCRTQKWQTPKVWWGEYAECKCNLSIQKHKSEIGQQSYCWKNLIKSSSFQRLKSVWTCRPKQSLQREGEWEFCFANPKQRPFQVLVCLFVCFFLVSFSFEDFLEFRTWTTTHLQIQVQLAASTAGRDRPINLRYRCMNPTARRNDDSNNVDRRLQRSFFHQITSLL